MQSSSGQSFVTTPGGNEKVELIECEATMRRRRSAFNVTTYKRSILRVKIANSCQ